MKWFGSGVVAAPLIAKEAVKEPEPEYVDSGWIDTNYPVSEPFPTLTTQSGSILFKEPMTYHVGIRKFEDVYSRPASKSIAKSIDKMVMEEAEKRLRHQSFMKGELW